MLEAAVVMSTGLAHGMVSYDGLGVAIALIDVEICTFIPGK